MAKASRRAACAALFACAATSVAAGAAQADRQRMSQEAIAIAKDLRNPDVPNQSLHESEDGKSAAMKARIYELLAEGRTREEVLAAFAAEYGERVRYEPALKATTVFLWAFPAALFAAALSAGVALLARRRNKGKKVG